ncbi:hypothetical protein LTR56_015460 [Elasticomyces elasticus]|nr:hypothetical protein LTR22_022643 [Elasticomyces elasticus]KAK3634114.1 hypothetical protein LTR56_015460 [Elasticomyces elasticus]KAK4909966.1 hypothetical protein LTR49_021308 [Elasticomyces elasticus]KAK5754886.1 hypothetical protein LTS12_015009 [Elasticomyces elasticus]
MASCRKALCRSLLLLLVAYIWGVECTGSNTSTAIGDYILAGLGASSVSSATNTSATTALSTTATLGTSTAQNTTTSLKVSESLSITALISTTSSSFASSAQSVASKNSSSGSSTSSSTLTDPNAPSTTVVPTTGSASLIPTASSGPGTQYMTNGTSSTGLGSQLLSSSGGISSSISLNASITASASTLTLPVSITPYYNGSTPQPVANNTTGLASARSCNASIYSWIDASDSYMYGGSSTISGSSVYTQIDTCQSVVADRFVTLCDGHPRALGSASYTQVLVTTLSTDYLYPVRSYTVPHPTCSIDASDCVRLWEEYTTSNLARMPQCITGNLTVPNTQITTQPSSNLPDYHASTTCAPSQGVCFIFAETMRLVYWPVRTNPGSDNLCDKHASTLHDTKSDTPRSAVYEGVTVTSPTVAMSLSNVGPGNCGTQIDRTVILVPPEQVFSVEGVRAEFNHLPFNLANLNFRCQAPNSTEYTIQDVLGDDCYQEVPAHAYFIGRQNFDEAVLGDGRCRPKDTTQVVIPNDYTPAVILPSVFYPVITSLWGPYCIPFIDGIWDPPVALTEISAAAGPTTPSAPVSLSTSFAPALKSSASPASAPPAPTPESTSPVPQANALPSQGQSEAATPQPEASPTPAALDLNTPPPVDFGNTTSEQADPVASLAIAINSVAASLQARPGLTPIASPPDPAEPATVQQAHIASLLAAVSTISSALGSSPDPTPQISTTGSVTVVLINTHTLTQALSAEGIVVLQNAQTSVTLVAGSAAVVLGSQKMSLDPGGQILGGSDPSLTTFVPVATLVTAASPALGSDIAYVDSSAKSTIVTIGSKSYTVGINGNGMYEVKDPTSTYSLQPGGSEVTVASQALSAGGHGMVVQSGLSATTVQIVSPVRLSSVVYTVGLESYTAVANSQGGYEVSAATTSFVVLLGGPALTSGSQVISAGPEGILIQSGTSSTAVRVGPHPSSPFGDYTLGLAVYTFRTNSGGGYELADATETLALLPGMVYAIGSETDTAMANGHGDLEFADATTTLLVLPGSLYTAQPGTYTAMTDGSGRFRLADATTTILLHPSTFYTIGSATYTAVQDGHNGFELVDAMTTVLLSPGSPLTFPSMAATSTLVGSATSGPVREQSASPTTPLSGAKLSGASSAVHNLSLNILFVSAIMLVLIVVI